MRGRLSLSSLSLSLSLPLFDSQQHHQHRSLTLSLSLSRGIRMPRCPSACAPVSVRACICTPLFAPCPRLFLFAAARACARGHARGRACFVLESGIRVRARVRHAESCCGIACVPRSTCAHVCVIRSTCAFPPRSGGLGRAESVAAPSLSPLLSPSLPRHRPHSPPPPPFPSLLRCRQSGGGACGRRGRGR